MHRDLARRCRSVVLGVGLSLAAFSSAPGQDAARMQPRSYRVVLENDSVRVLEFNSRPGRGVCGDGVHSHPAHLTVALSPAKVRVRAGGKTFVATNKLGDVFWSEAETHETENLSGANIRALIIEIKAPRRAPQ
jgi:hypothetical protein